MSKTLTDRSAHPADLAFASLLSGALGSAAIALLFLIIDSLRGEPFFTPSLMGSVLFAGAVPTDVETVRTGLMALYTIVHFVSFTALGTAATLAYTRWTFLPRHPLALAGVVLVALTLGTIAVDQLIAPGLAGAIGAVPLVVANTLAAVVMGFFIHRTLEEAAMRQASAFSGPAGPSAHVGAEARS